MLRFLVVEDIADTLDQFKKLLLEEFDEAEVDTARTVNEGMVRLDSARRSGEDYDVVILDFRLPRDLGDNLEIDETLCGIVSLHMPDALIVHISSYGEDPIVKKHLANHKPRQGYLVSISKLNTSWPTEIVAVIRHFIHSVRIDAKMDRLFRTRRGGGGATYEGRRADAGLPCLTLELDDVMQDIAEHWNDLDVPLLLRVEEVFDVDTSSSPPVISLRGIPSFPQLAREERRHDP